MARLGGLLFWAALALLGFLLAPILRLWLTQAANLPVRELGRVACSLGVTCGVQSEGIQLTLNLPPRMRTLTPYNIQVRLEGLMAQHVHAQFEMVGMEMHLPPTAFVHERQTNTWQATVILPVCSLGRSDWQVWVTADDGARGVRAQFNFQLSAGGDAASSVAPPRQAASAR